MVRYTPDNQLRLEGFETPFRKVGDEQLCEPATLVMNILALARIFLALRKYRGF